MIDQLLKVTGPLGEATHGGTFTYDLPKVADPIVPGEWTTPISKLRLCASGYHVTSHPMEWAKVGMRVWEVETRGLSDEGDDDQHKRVASSIRLTRERPDLIPDWWRAVEDFIATIGTVAWFDAHGTPDPDWKVFETRAAAWAAARDAARDAAWDAAGAAAWAAARDAAGDAARDAAWDAAGAAAGAAARDAAGDAAGAAAWAAARDAALVARVLVCDGLPLDQRHIDHAWARWRVWQAGYGVSADVDGVLFCYRRVA